MPPLVWEFVEPAELLDPGWGLLPATRANEVTISARLTGAKVSEFKGNVGFTVDGKDQPFAFENNVLSAKASGLETGKHHIQVWARSATGYASRSLIFEVLEHPPSMQLGIGEDDGKLYATLDRPMPASQLNDPNLWNCDSFGLSKQSVAATIDNHTVAIELSSPLSFEDTSWLENMNEPPKVIFNSSLGPIEAGFWGIGKERGGQAERRAQVAGCLQGSVWEQDVCTPPVCRPPLDWVIELQHLVSEGNEARRVFNIEKPFLDWPYFPWGDCRSWTVVRYNWVKEGHLNPSTCWDDQYDTLINSNEGGYSGIGYMYGAYEPYWRDYSYNKPSWCSNTWQMTINCHECDPQTYPGECRSKGMNLPFPDNDWLYCDHDPPEFGSPVEFMTPSELDDYVAGQLANELLNMGHVFGSDGTPLTTATQIYNYYHTRLGGLEPGCIVAKAYDPESDQGRFLWPNVSIDYDEGGNHYSFEDYSEYFFCVDVEPYAGEEWSSEDWPWDRGYPYGWEMDPLPVDGLGQGEFCVWIIPFDCDFLALDSCRLRIRDDCNNWRRSEELAPGGNVGIEITSPEDGAKFPYDSEVVFTAAVEGNEFLSNLEEYIEWEILTPDYESLIPEWEDWTGPTFDIEHFRDCTIRVRASIEICGQVFDDTSGIQIDADYQIADIGILVDDTYLLGPYYPPECDRPPYLDRSTDSACDFPVMARNVSGLCTIDYAVLVLTDAPPAVAACVLPESIPTTVTSPTNEDFQSVVIDVSLYRVAESVRRETLDCLFGGAPSGQWAYYYARGTDLLVTGGQADMLAVNDMMLSQSSDQPDVPPRLFLSDRDDLIAPGGDVDWNCANPIMQTKDYSIAMSPDVASTFGDMLDSMKYAYPERGRFLPECNTSEGIVKPYFDDVLKVGLEMVQVQCEDLTAEVGVQSRGDVFYLLCHGGPRCDDPDFSKLNPEAQDYAWQKIQIVIQTREGMDTQWLGPFMDANGLDKSIHSPDLANGLSVEANWLVSPACGMLTKISYTRWKTALVNSGGHLKAICGFGAKEMGSYLSADFFEEFSGRLARNHCQPEENDWWQVSAPSDPGVIAWMENACNRLNNWDPGRGPLYELIPETEAAAVDQLTRYRLYSPGGAYTGAHYTIIADP